jgi:MFS family permease
MSKAPATDHTAKHRGQPSPWFILSVVLLASMAGTINYYKVPPLMPFLMSAFRLSGGRAGFLMSIFAVVGILLSIPAGLIQRKLGLRAAGLMGIAWIAAGAGLGAVSTSTIGLMSTRLMEGVGLNLMAIVAPTIIAVYFSGKKRATAVGIWSAWYPLGSTITFMTAPFLAFHWGWRSVWWFGSLYAIAVGFLYFASIRPLPAMRVKNDPADPVSRREAAGSKETFLNRDLWCLSVMFFSFAFIYVSFLTWTATFLHRVRGVSLTQAAFLMSLFSILSLISSPSSGWLLGRVRSARPICISVVALFSALALSICFVRVRYVLPLVVVMGMMGSFIPVATFTLAAQLMHEGKVGAMAMSMVTIGQNTGIFFGPTLFGRAMESAGGWPSAYTMFVPVGLLGIGAALLLGRSRPASYGV